ncbi:MAG TPA: 2,4'-dihydroxyacetophenone dioxygenase family protein [Phenylobacterium sp.]
MDDAAPIPQVRAVPLPPAGHEAIHRSLDEVPFVQLGEGNALQLLQVDLAQGLWIVRTRFAPGHQVQTHYHTGVVFAVTEQGRWFYSEYPDVVNSPGSYLYEPAGSLHTLTIPKDQDGPTQVWFAIYGANVNVDPAGQVLSITDAHTILPAYRALCKAQGLSSERVIVSGG